MRKALPVFLIFSLMLTAFSLAQTTTTSSQCPSTTTYGGWQCDGGNTPNFYNYITRTKKVVAYVYNASSSSCRETSSDTTWEQQSCPSGQLCNNGVCVQQATTSTTAITAAPTTTFATTTTTLPPTTTTTLSKKLTGDLTGVKEKTFPQENLDLRLTVKDENGKLITDASVSGTIKQAGVTKNYLYPSYSYLCDCYKTSAWISESYLGDYTIDFKVSKSNYPSISITKTFTVEKPSLKLSVKTEKETYYGNDKIIFIITAADQNGNTIQPSWTADIRDETGGLVQIAYPYTSGSEYRYDYYAKSDDVGKTLTFNAKAKWKEQEASASSPVTIQKRAISADVVLEKTELKAGEYIRGKIKVIDQSGAELKDAYVEAQLVGPEGNQIQFFTTTYSNGVYEFDQRKIEDWYSTGEYKLKIKVEKYPDKITFEKVLKISRDKLQVKTEFDRTSYKPGDRIFLKILVTSPEGDILEKAYVNGEIFPLSQEPRKLPGEPYPDYVKSIEQCRIYLSPQGPIYYQAQFIQKFFIDEVWLPESCPTGTYVLRMKVGHSGYEEVQSEKEFEVVLQKIIIESGARVKSQPGGADIKFYTELKDETGNLVPNARVFGLLHPLEEKGCLQKVEYYWDHQTKRYFADKFISLPECPEGAYVIELTAEQNQYSPSNSTSVLEVKYESGYEYREFRPTAVKGDEFCEAVSCGPGCFQRVCSMPTCSKVFDEGCIEKCKTIPAGAGIDIVENCLRTCEKEQCGPEQSSQDEMLSKLEQIRREIQETKEITQKTGEGVNAIQKLLRSILSFIANLLGLQVSEIESAAPTVKTPVPATAPPAEESQPFVGGKVIAG